MNKNYMTALILALIALTLIVFFVFLLAGAVKDGELTLTKKTNKLEESVFALYIRKQRYQHS